MPSSRACAAPDLRPAAPCMGLLLGCRADGLPEFFAHQRAHHQVVDLGLRLKDPAYTYEHVQMAGGLMVQAMALRNVQVQVALAEPPAAAGQGGQDDGGLPGEDTAGEKTEGVLDLTEPRYVDGLLNGPIPGPGLDGQPAPWTLVTLAYLALVDAFMEPDPDFVPPAAPAGQQGGGQQGGGQQGGGQ